MWCNLKKIKRLFFPITSFLLLLLGILFANNFVFLFSRFFNPFSEAPGNGNSYAESQKDNAGQSVYEIWWKGFNAGGYQENTICGEQPWLNCKFGNVQGIIDKLDYIKSLNVDYLWITPFFQSPQLDNGYDIADYYNVDSLFGINADFQQLLKRAHEKDLKVIIDLVMNHTSREHPWFLWASGRPVSSSPFWKKEMYAKFIKNNNRPQGDDLKFPQFDEIPTKEIQNYYQDYYWFWKKEIKDIKKFDEEIKGKKQSEVYPPFFHDNGLNDNIANNWQRWDLNFREFAYQQKLFLPKIQEKYIGGKNQFFPYSLVNSYEPFNKETNSYYLHTFSDFQPDLNWNNPHVRKEMEKIANFYIKGKDWLKGEKIDGMRFDAVTLISKFGWKNDKDNKYLGYYDPHNELLVPSSNLDKYLGNFKDATYGPANLFTVGELSQASADDKEATAKNTKVAKEMFTTAYLPLDTLWNYKIKRDGTTYPKETDFPLSKKNFGMFFNEFLRDSYFSSQIFGNNSALIAENHDQPRSVSRFYSPQKIDSFYDGHEKDEHYFYQGIKKGFYDHNPSDINNTDFQNKVFPRAKALAAFKFLQPGIPFIYQGQEWSMDNYPFYYEDVDKTFFDKEGFLKSVDPQARVWVTRAYINKDQDLKDIVDYEDKVMLRSPAQTGRDSARTPLQWNDDKKAGWPFRFDFVTLNKKNLKDIQNQNEKNALKEAIPDSFGVIYLSKKKIDEWNKTDVKLNISSDEFYRNFKNYIYGEKKSNIIQLFLSGKVYPLILNPHYKDINFRQQKDDSSSPFRYYSNLQKLRRSSYLSDILKKGSLYPLTEGKEFKVVNSEKNYFGNYLNVSAFIVKYKNKRLLVITELGNKKEIVKINNNLPAVPEKEVLSLGFNSSYLNRNEILFNGGVKVFLFDVFYLQFKWIILFVNNLLLMGVLIFFLFKKK